MEDLSRTTGSMLKKGGGKSRLGENLVQSKLHRRNWQQRWFVLDVEAGELRYYKDATLARYKGCVRLTAESSIKIPDTVHLRGRHRPTKDRSLNYFEIHDTMDEKGRARRRPFSLRAPSGEELVEWLRSLHSCLLMLRREEVRALSSRPCHGSAIEEHDDDNSDIEEDDSDDIIEEGPPLADLPADERKGSWHLDELQEVLCASDTKNPLPQTESPSRAMKRRPPPPPTKQPPSTTLHKPANLSAAVDRTVARRLAEAGGMERNKFEALDALVLATASDNPDAIAVSIEHALEEAGCNPGDPIILAAKAKLAVLEQPSEMRAAKRRQVEAALGAAADVAQLGSAISDAVAFGLPLNTPSVIDAQARLCALVAKTPMAPRRHNDPEDLSALEDSARQSSSDRLPDNITRLFVC